MPNGITILGKTGLTEIGRKRHFDPSRGPVDTIIYEGTHEDVQAAEASIAGANLIYECDYTLGTPKARFTISTPDFVDNTGGDGLISTVYEMPTSPANRSGYEHPKSLGISAANLRTIKDSLKRNAAPSGLTGNASTLYSHMLNGQESFMSFNAVFRVVHTITRIATVNVSFTDVGRVYSNAALINETGASGVYNAAIINAFANYPFSAPSGFTLGWLKAAPSFATVAGNRVAVSIEWYLEAWSNYYYTA